MNIHLVNPSDVSFGIGVITPRWLYVLAGATPRCYGTPVITDETLSPFKPEQIQAGDVVGIGIHTSNAWRGYQIGQMVRRRGGIPIFGGIHATLYPDEPCARGNAAAVVRGDGDLAWPQALADCASGNLKPLYEGGIIAAEDFAMPRWDLLHCGSYMWASVQTIRGCPKHCSFCSVWRTDGQKPRQRRVDAVVEEIVTLRRMGYRFIALADDNFYPVSLQELEQAAGRNNPDTYQRLCAIREERFELMRRLKLIHSDLIMFTQITMEAAEDDAFMQAMKEANIKGALVGVESVDAAGLQSMYKGFNMSGEKLVSQLKKFRRSDIHVLGSFIFGLATDTPSTFDATSELADRAELTFAQFVPLTPFPGTLDFEKWEKDLQKDHSAEEAAVLARSWLIPPDRRPKIYLPHPTMSPEEIRRRTQEVWSSFYSFRKIWKRSRCVSRFRSRLAFILISKLYRQMYANTGISTESSHRSRAVRWARLIAIPCRMLFAARPLPQLQAPAILADSESDPAPI